VENILGRVDGSIRVVLDVGELATAAAVGLLAYPENCT
jgi:hypothetical protein